MCQPISTQLGHAALENYIYVGSNTCFVHFKVKTINGHKYLYLIKNQRVDGKIKQVLQMYVGSADKIYELMTSSSGKTKVASFSFGKGAALLHAARDVGFLDAVDKHITRRQQEGLTVGQYLFLLIAGRSEGALSRRQIEDWFPSSSLCFLWHPVHSLSSQNCLNYMRRLSDDGVIESIERDIAERLISRGYYPTRLILDTTNQFTYIEKGEELPRKGRSKQKRYDKNIVGLALAVNDSNLPFLSSVYPGNKHDSDVFVEFFNAICSRLEDLKVDRKKITLIFDRGVNSEINVGNVVDKMHIVGALTRSQAKDFFTIPLDDFSFLYKNMKEHVIKGYRFENAEFFGKKFTLVTSYNEATYKRQKKTYERRKKKILEGVEKLRKKAVRKGRGRKLTMKGATNRLVDMIPRQLRGVFDYSVSKGENGLLDIKCDIITGAEKDLYRSFGKNAIFTDNKKWTSEEIVRAYNSKSEIEDDFKWLHDKVLIPLQPFWVWRDISLRAHVFLCVMGLLLYRYLLVELSYEQLSLPRLAKMLEDIRLAVVKEGEKKAHIVVEEMAAEQAHIFSTLQLDRFVPK